MLKLSLWRAIAVLLLPLLISACGGGGSSAPPPSGGITVVPGNGQAFVTWTADPGVDYQVIYLQTAAATSGQDIYANPLHLWVNGATAVTSPLVATGLTNGLPYTFAINGRTGTGQGGAFSAIQTITPRAAGANWIPGSYAGTAPTSDLHGLSYGTADNVNYYYLAVGDNGAMYQVLDSVSQSLNGYTWTPITTAPVVNYKAAINAFSRYIAVGSGTANNISYSTDLTGSAWTPATTAVSTGLNALASNGTYVVAVGDGGKAFYTGDGNIWNPVTTGTTANLYGLTYSSTYGWVAVGQGGLIITSPDLATWTPHPYTGAGNDLHGVTVTSSNVFVAVGNGGTVVTSSDSANWTTQTLASSSNLYAISTDSAQFLAVGQNGATYTSTSIGTGSYLDGLTWTVPVPVTAGSKLPTSTTLYSIFGSASKYLGVGLAGANFSSIN